MFSIHLMNKMLTPISVSIITSVESRITLPDFSTWFHGYRSGGNWYHSLRKFCNSVC